MDKDFVLSEQIEKARAVNLIEYLQRIKPGNLVRSASNEYRLKDHDNLKISNEKFNWFSGDGRILLVMLEHAQKTKN